MFKLYSPGMAELTAAATTPEPSKESATLVLGSSVVDRHLCVRSRAISSGLNMLS